MTRTSKETSRPASDLLFLLLGALAAACSGLALIWILDYFGMPGLWRVFTLANAAFLPYMLWKCRAYLAGWPSRLQFGAWIVAHLSVYILLVWRGLPVLLLIILFGAEAMVVQSYFSARAALKKS